MDRVVQDVPEAFRYSFAQTSVAALLIATSDKGLVAVLMAERSNEAALANGLAVRFTAVRLIRAEQDLAREVEVITDFVERPKRDIALPLDLRANGFAAQVYRAVLDIPFGETRTFAEIAKATGRPKAFRAVGSGSVDGGKA